MRIRSGPSSGSPAPGRDADLDGPWVLEQEASAEIVNVEVEAKFDCPEGLDRSALAALLGPDFELSEARTVRQRDVYYDTPGECLRRAGLSARCRNRDGGRSIELKAVPILPEVAMSRTEIVADLLEGHDPAKEIKRLAEASLPLRLEALPRPIAVVENRRELYEVHDGSFRGELCLDEVEISPPEGEPVSRFGELEIEWTEGERGGFDGAVARLGGEGGLEPSRRSKLLRAREALGLDAFHARTPRPDFRGKDPSGRVAARLLGQGLGEIRRMVPGARVGLDPEYVHGMRVTTRRLRALLAFLRPVLGEAHDALRGELAWLAEVLGRVRDLDVQKLQVADEAAADPEHRLGWVRLGELLEGRWRSARAALLSTFDSERFEGLLDAGEELSRDENGSKRPVLEIASAALLARVEALDASRRRLERRRDVESAHALRIATKKLRYAATAFRPLFKKRLRARLRFLPRLQDELGAFQDAAVIGRVAAELLAQARGRTEPEDYVAVLGRLVGRAEALESGIVWRTRALLEHLGFEDRLTELRRSLDRLK